MLSIYLNTPACILSSSTLMMQNKKDCEKNEYVKREEVLADSILSRTSKIFSQPDQQRTLPNERSSSGSKWYESSKTLGPNYTPGPYDVICARGKVAWNHSGNRRFRALVSEATDAYSKADNKTGRTYIVSQIVENVKSKGVGFVKQESAKEGGAWIEVGDLLAREKAGQMLRNALSSRYRSSIRNKKQRRRNVHEKRRDDLHDLMATNEDIHHSMLMMKQQSSTVSNKRGDENDMSDAQLMDFFTKQNSNILAAIKADDNLLDRFLQAEVTASLVLNTATDDDTDSDGDVPMIEV